MTNRKQIVRDREYHSTHTHPCEGEVKHLILTALTELSEPAERTSQD